MPPRLSPGGSHANYGLQRGLGPSRFPLALLRPSIFTLWRKAVNGARAWTALLDFRRAAGWNATLDIAAEHRAGSDALACNAHSHAGLGGRFQVPPYLFQAWPRVSSFQLAGFQLPSQPVPARANRQPNFLAHAPSASGAARSPHLTGISRKRLRARWQGPAGEALGIRPCAHRENNIPQIAPAPQIPSTAPGHTRCDARRAATLGFRVAVGRRQSKISKRSHGKAWGFWLLWSSGSSSLLQDDKTITLFTTTSVRKTAFRASGCTASTRMIATLSWSCGAQSTSRQPASWTATSSFLPMPHHHVGVRVSRQRLSRTEDVLG